MDITLTLIDFLVIVAIVGFFTRRSYLERSCSAAENLRMRRQLDAIMEHLGLPEPPVSSTDRLSPQVLALLAEARMIDAIRLYRQETGAPLKEAKDAIDQYRNNITQR